MNVSGWIDTGSAEPGRQQQDLNELWSVFRSAALEKDWKKLEELTNFPLRVRGELDRDRTRRVDRREFSKVFDRFLREGVFSPHEQLDFIRKTTSIDMAANSRDTCRIGDMIFKRTSSGWRLHTLYMHTSD